MGENKSKLRIYPENFLKTKKLIKNLRTASLGSHFTNSYKKECKKRV